MLLVRAYRAAFLEQFPWMRSEPDDVQAIVYNHGQQTAQAHPDWPFDDVPKATTAALRRSTLAGTSEAAERLDPLSTRAAGPPPPSTRLKVSMLTNAPLIAPSDIPGKVWAFGDHGSLSDLGEDIGRRSGHCAILCLAAAVGVRPADLLKKFELEAQEVLQGWVVWRLLHCSSSAAGATCHVGLRCSLRPGRNF